MGNTPLGVLCSAIFFGIIQSSGSTVSLNLFPSARRIGSIRKASQRPPPPSLPRSPTSLLLLPLSLLSRDGGLLFSGSSAESASGGVLGGSVLQSLAEANSFACRAYRARQLYSQLLWWTCGWGVPHARSFSAGPKTRLFGLGCSIPLAFALRKLGIPGWVCGPARFRRCRKLGVLGWGGLAEYT